MQGTWMPGFIGDYFLSGSSECNVGAVRSVAQGFSDVYSHQRHYNDVVMQSGHFRIRIFDTEALAFTSYYGCGIENLESSFFFSV